MGGGVVSRMLDAGGSEYLSDMHSYLAELLLNMNPAELTTERIPLQDLQIFQYLTDKTILIGWLLVAVVLVLYLVVAVVLVV